MSKFMNTVNPEAVVHENYMYAFLETEKSFASLESYSEVLEDFVPEEILTEGFIDSIKNFFSKIWEKLAAICRWIGRKIRAGYEWIKGLFTKKKKEESSTADKDKKEDKKEDKPASAPASAQPQETKNVSAGVSEEKVVWVKKYIKPETIKKITSFIHRSANMFKTKFDGALKSINGPYNVMTMHMNNFMEENKKEIEDYKKLIENEPIDVSFKSSEIQKMNEIFKGLDKEVKEVEAVIDSLEGDCTKLINDYYKVPKVKMVAISKSDIDKRDAAIKEHERFASEGQTRNATALSNMINGYYKSSSSFVNKLLTAINTAVTNAITAFGVALRASEVEKQAMAAKVNAEKPAAVPA